MSRCTSSLLLALSLGLTSLARGTEPPKIILLEGSTQFVHELLNISYTSEVALCKVPDLLVADLRKKIVQETVLGCVNVREKSTAQKTSEVLDMNVSGVPPELVTLSDLCDFLYTQTGVSFMGDQTVAVPRGRILASGSIREVFADWARKNQCAGLIFTDKTKFMEELLRTAGKSPKFDTPVIAVRIVKSPPPDDALPE